MKCVKPNCVAEATFISPADWCDEHWQEWWDCEVCTSTQDCDEHKNPRNP
jgi:hypothetical protein